VTWTTRYNRREVGNIFVNHWNQSNLFSVQELTAILVTLDHVPWTILSSNKFTQDWNWFRCYPLFLLPSDSLIPHEEVGESGPRRKILNSREIYSIFCLDPFFLILCEALPWHVSHEEPTGDWWRVVGGHHELKILTSGEIDTLGPISTSYRMTLTTVEGMAVFKDKPRPPNKPVGARQKSHQSQFQTPIWGQADLPSQTEKSPSRTRPSDTDNKHGRQRVFWLLCFVWVATKKKTWYPKKIDHRRGPKENNQISTLLGVLNS
jgi:hypothetical protein